ncbi:MAG: MG2 domain-containing protein [Bacteroidota bacterium]
MEADAAKCPEKFSVTFLRTLLFITATTILFSCNKTKWIEVDTAFSRYIDAYTTGMVSKTSTVRLQLANSSNTTHTVGEVVKEDLFDFSPSVKGKAAWIDATTIEFKPSENLKPNQLYEVRFNLAKVTSVSESKLKEFKFNIQTVKPSFVVKDYGLRSAAAKGKMFLNGELETADIEDGKSIEKLLTATQNKLPLTINWQHNDAAKSHIYTIEGITRGSNVNNVDIKWNGKSLDMDVSGEKQIAVPAAGEFKVLNVMAMNEAQQYASVQFSDPVAIGQDLTGLISFSNQSDVSYTINGSEVKLFGTGNLDGNYTVNINSGIKNTWGDILEQGFTSNINFENKLPNVKIYGKGNILPNSGRLVLPFESVNLNAVDISIIKIYENNVPRFLQDNSLDGNSSLRRVARPVVEKTLRLDDDKTLDLHKKQRFSLDIDKFLKTEQGAIYRVTIGFRPQYSLYSKVDTTQKSGEDEEEEYYGGYYDDESQGGVDDDEEFWRRYDTYYPYGYNWQRRDDPNSKSYYNKDRWATRNILASNIGITAKRGNDNQLSVAVSNILTTEPMGDVDIEVMDYQQAIISKGKSGSDGFANIELKRKPYLLVAKKGNERGYLKLDDGSSLTLSRFDVSGEEIKNGIKGFIFGERGVWRPGDTMFINCIIEDREGKLPKDHPVEFSLYTPQNQLYKHAVQSNAEDGFYLFKTNTDASSPTGNWLAKIKCGGATFEKRIRVETVMPNRLKINVDFGNNPLLGTGGTTAGTINAKWLFGAVGKNLKAKIDASLYAKQTSFAKFAGYVFDNPTSDYSTQTKTMFDGTLDAEGNATLKPEFETDEAAPGMLNANLLVKVFEPGGAFSIDNVTMNYSPYASYAGLKLPQGQKPFNYLLAGNTHIAELADVDAKGNAIAGRSQLEVQFYRIQWRWWWDDNGDNLSNFTQNSYNKLIKSDTVNITNGKGQWQFKTSTNEWGRYLLLVKDVKSGHMTGSTFYIDDPYWQSRSGNDEDQTAATMLSFSSNKEKYNVGEEAVLNIPSSKGGRVLVSLENGSKVIKSFWKETEQGQTQVKFNVEQGMAPNIYATVSLLQPHSQTVNDLPIRMYGSIPIFIEDKNTILKPVLNIAGSIRPEQQASFTVSEQDGKEMTYCVAIVDEGLLDLTRFKTPDPHSAFYAREALGVKSFDMFDYVIGAWSGGLERILTIGGDAEGGPVKQKTANRFKPVVAYLGPFHLGKGDKQTKTFTLPSYIGSVRAMVVAAHEGAYGFAEKNVAVKKPLMILATMPRVLGPGETIKLPVTVFAMENNIKNVNLSLQSNPYLEVVGSNTQNISFAQTGEQMAYFDVRVKPNTGIGKVKLLASSGGEKANYEVELEIRNPNPPVTSVSEMVLNAGQQWNVTASAIGSPNTSTAIVEISSVPPMNLQKRLDYLIQYPHGCIEQTTSSVFPQLVLNQLTDLDDYKKSLVDKNIKAGVLRLQNFQRPDGGFSYWPGMAESDAWGSNYAGHFLIEAQANGYFVSDYMLAQWKNFQRGRANSWTVTSENYYGADLDQAYRLFTLALAKAPELGAMNRLKEFKYLSAEAKWRLAAAYKLSGQENTALQLISGLTPIFETRTKPGFTFGSDLRDQAMVLETLTLLGRKAQAAQLLTTVAGKLSQDSWYSTQTTAYSLIAIAKYCGKNPSGAKIVAKASIGGKATDINSAAYIRQLPVSIQKGNSNVVISNKGSNILYVRLITQGQPLSGDSLKVNNNPAVLSMNVTYITQDGKALDVTKLSQGSDFVAKVIITNTGKRGRYDEMALSQIFPSGWEILNARMTGGEGAFKSSISTYQDVRDDRVYTYFDINESETLTYYVQLNASYLGRYFMPGIYTSAMYDNTINAGVNGKWVEVVNQ